MISGYHAANILDPSYNYVGVGVAYGSDGKVYVAQVFGALVTPRGSPAARRGNTHRGPEFATASAPNRR